MRVWGGQAEGDVFLLSQRLRGVRTELWGAEDGALRAVRSLGVSAVWL